MSECSIIRNAFSLKQSEDHNAGSFAQTEPLFAGLPGWHVGPKQLDEVISGNELIRSSELLVNPFLHDFDERSIASFNVIDRSLEGKVERQDRDRNTRQFC